MAKTYNFVLTGRVAAGHTRDAAAAALAKIMRVPEQRALELLAGKETVIKRNLDAAGLARYQGAFSLIGVEVRSDEILAPTVPAPAPVAAATAPAEAKVALTSAPAPAAAETSTCPACGTVQPKRNLCRQCGGDMRRLAAAKAEAASAPLQQAPSTPMSGRIASLPGTVRVEEDNSSPHPLNVLSFVGRIGRLRYLAFSFPAYLPLIGAAILGGVLGGLSRSAKVFIVLLVVGGLATIALGVRIAVLRLHDLNLSGKWVLLPLVTLLAILTGSPMLMLLSGAVVVFGTLALCVWPGSMMSNDYGPPPAANTIWTIVGAVLFILLSIIGVFSGGGAPTEDEV